MSSATNSLYGVLATGSFELRPERRAFISSAAYDNDVRLHKELIVAGLSTGPLGPLYIEL